MLLTNYHTHFELDDGSGTLQDYAESAAAKGLSIIGFSPHAPLPYTNDWAMTEENCAVYLGLAKKVKKEWAGRLEVYTGLEIDYIPGKGGPSNNKYKSMNLDYRIGSVHSIMEPESGEELSVDGPVEDLIRLLERRFGRNAENMVDTYFNLEMEMLEAGGFDILGHCDLIKKRNTDNRFFDPNMKRYRDKALEMLKIAAAKDVVIEVNTGGLSRGAITELYPSPWMLKQCCELGIPLTLSADAHQPDHLDFHLTEAVKEVKSAGYREIYFFSEGKWRPQPI
ncbi:MAG: histidinol-phosphatase [Spirochaetales bacterium]|nr:histidinol-phosphatase [Spirochaetales bacterium]